MEAELALLFTVAHFVLTSQERGIKMTSPGDNTTEIVVPVEIFVSPDGKMANIVTGHASNGSEWFCVKCDVGSKELASNPFKIYQETRTKVMENG